MTTAPFPTAQLAAAYLALRLTPGAPVRYHGSIPQAHGAYTAHPCPCPDCTRQVLTGAPATHYELRTPAGKPGPSHVRHTSVTPLPGEDELNEAATLLPTTVTARHLRTLLRRTFPGVLFFVRATENTPGDITVRWTGGPTTTAVRTVTAPLLATWGTPDRCRPAPITVTVNGRTTSGLPSIAALHLHRS